MDFLKAIFGDDLYSQAENKVSAFLPKSACDVGFCFGI